MSSASKPSKETPELYLFLSVDIIDSTKIKYDTDNPINWYNSFREFYISFPEFFVNHLKMEYAYNSLKYDPYNYKIWKHAGDEILSYINITMKDEVPCIVQAFKRTLEEWLSPEEKKLKIKGNIWLGQIPFIDRKLLPEENSRHQRTINIPEDFIGPSIDCGFRIGKYSSQNNITISVEVADLCKGYPSLQSSLYYLTSENLKGVFGSDNKYPIFVIHLNTDDDTNEYKFLLHSCDATKLNDYIKAHYSTLGEKYKSKISRIDKNIPKYLNDKKKASQEAVLQDTEIKPITEAAIVSAEEKGNEERFVALSSQISSLSTNNK